VTLKEELLVMLNCFGGKVIGKTRLMKYVYFVSELRGVKKSGFRPYFYGPYSDEVSSALEALVFLGLVEQKRTEHGPGDRGYEKVLFEYTLTNDGVGLAQALAEQHSKEAQSIRGAADKLASKAKKIGYMELSCAAKAHFLLRQGAGKKMTVQSIVEKARTFDWKLRASEAQRCADLLVDMGLAEKKN